MNLLTCAETSAIASALGVVAIAGQHVDLVADDQFLREPLGHIRRNAARVLADEFEFLASDGVTMLLHIELDAVVHLRCGIGELARVRTDQADLDGLLGLCGCSREHDGRRDNGLHHEQQLAHHILLVSRPAACGNRIISSTKVQHNSGRVRAHPRQVVLFAERPAQSVPPGCRLGH